MKILLPVLIMAMLMGIISCSKTSFITSPEAAVAFSSDTLHYDTVFTTTGSVTQSFKVFNQNDQKLRLSAIKLMGGASSAYKMNVDGSAGISFSNVELEPNDSIYIFVTVSVNPSAANLPFIIQDSILISYNGNDHFVQLEAYGQNAHFMRGVRITTDTTWINDLPYVILDSVSVDENATLTIEGGSRIFHHANAPFIINGTLHTNGDSSARITFSGDRLDPGYKDLPGSWPGLIFNNSSGGNFLNYTTIKNAYQGIVAEGQPAAIPYKIELSHCIIQNIYDAGIFGINSSIRAINCLIANCGANIYLYAGGKYWFDYCTVVSYGNFLLTHQTPVLTVTDADVAGNPFALDASFSNSIFYGDNGTVDDEVVTIKKGGNFAVNFKNIIYKNKSGDIADATVTTSKKNEDPDFGSIDVTRGIYDFNLKNTSPAIDAGDNSDSILTDLNGNPRPLSGSDIGCYERQ